MNTDKFNTLAEKIYPNKQDRDDAKYAIEMILATERLVNAEKDYEDVQKEIKAYLEKHNGNFKGSFLIPRNNKILSDLKNLIDFTFGEKSVVN